MKIPAPVVWQLTKRWNSQLVKFNGQQFTHDPLSLTNFHNASSSSEVGLSSHKEKSKKKGSRRVITLLQKHKSNNKISKPKKNSQRRLQVSVVDLKRGINRVARAVQGLSHISEKTRKAALKRVQRLHVATRPHVKGDKKVEKK